MYPVGSHVLDKHNNERVQIVECKAVWGYVSYKVYNPASGSVYQLAEEALTADKREDDCNVYYLRYVSMLEKIKSETC